MKVIIYESSSKGGCYEYAQYLYRACLQKKVSGTLWLPKGSSLSLTDLPDQDVKKVLLADQKILSHRIISRFNFLFRQFYNPIRFLIGLSVGPKSIVIWNDFEQLSAPLWTLLLSVIARRHYHVIVLHDPDRDHYPLGKSYSVFCMKLIMSRMQLALYHGYLPDKPYYQKTKTIFQSIVHGVYDAHEADVLLMDKIQQWKGNNKLLSVIGNIREEKNYDLIIQALVKMPDFKLLIAGAPANSAVNIDRLKQHAQSVGVFEQIMFECKFLTDSELSSCIQASDIILLYYRPEFTSQSGVLNLLAPYKKQFIYTDASSGLQEVCKKYDIGQPCQANDAEALIQKINNMDWSLKKGLWEEYLQAANWINIIDVIQYNSKSI